jgi:hypothetical protein
MRIGRLVKLTIVCLLPGLVLGVFAWSALARMGLVYNPFDPTIAGDLAAARSTRAGYRVLFVGNSLTYTHDLPGTLDRLVAAQPGPVPMFVVSDTRPSTGLDYWAGNNGLRELIAEVPWDIVVLQERSVTPSLGPDQVAEYMDPPLRALDSQVRARGASTLLFETWAHEHGGFDGDSYDAMQLRIDSAYDDAGTRLRAQVAPVGRAWQLAHALHPSLDLWGGDDTHPSATGTYLAACVFYATLTHRSPAGDPYLAGIDPPTAHMLQRLAAQMTGVS